jgi:hypothetical protein
VNLPRISRFLAAASTASLLLCAGGAHAAVIAMSSAPQTYAADAMNSTNLVCTFDAACVGPFSIALTGAAAIQTGSNAMGAAPPGDTTAYLTVAPGGTATLSAGGNIITSLSFFMGSPDTYNMVSFFSGSTLLQTLTGANFNGASPNGDQTVGQRISFTGLPSNLTSVSFTSVSPAFEIDRIMATSVAMGVPEPASWGLMILGFGLVGAGLRRRRTLTTAAPA